MVAIWTNNLSIGNRVIDSAHKDILGIIFKITFLIGERDESLTETYKLLENSLYAYFEVEEKFAHAINVDFTQHKLTHQRLLKDFQSIKNVLEEKNGVWSDREKVVFINSWAKRFIRHITEDGKEMKIMLDTHYYDFQPD